MGEVVYLNKTSKISSIIVKIEMEYLEDGSVWMRTVDVRTKILGEWFKLNLEG